jgi:biotin carboxyl carrier protein
MDLIARMGDSIHEIAVEIDAEPASNGSAAPQRLRVRVDGREHSLDVHSLGAGGGLSVLLDGRPFDVALLPDGKGLRLGDRVYAVEIDEARRFRSRLAAAGPRGLARETVAAPMPGLVVAIPVSEGERVSPGQTVAVIEAMKMQNELVAEGAGRVREVRAAPGQVVESGAPLVILDRETA